MFEKTNVIVVASGKGGVGKSTVAVNIACGLGKLGHRVGLLDADIYGPSQHIMLGLKNRDPQLTEDKKMVPFEQHGIQVISFGFFVKPDEAVVWRGPMISRMFEQFCRDVAWGDLDYLVVDLPPGTGDIQLTLSQKLQVTGVVIVSTPQDVALADAIKGVNMFQKVGVGILGLVENMSYFSCPHCHEESAIFSHGGGKKMALKLGIPLLAELPINPEICKSSDEGTPIVLQDTPQAKIFLELASKVEILAKEIKRVPPPSPHAHSTPAFDV